MVKSRRVLTREFKLAAIKELDSASHWAMWRGSWKSQHAISLAPRFQRATYESVFRSGPPCLS